MQILQLMLPGRNYVFTQSFIFFLYFFYLKKNQRILGKENSVCAAGRCAIKDRCGRAETKGLQLSPFSLDNMLG